ncbi:MAG: hypothetical protein Q8O89_07330 [Nanoarchaeota archaeon]|nr:hypothetical protein [Nanoarchaeota archaeon]
MVWKKDRPPLKNREIKMIHHIENGLKIPEEEYAAFYELDKTPQNVGKKNGTAIYWIEKPPHLEKELPTFWLKSKCSYSRREIHDINQHVKKHIQNTDYYACSDKGIEQKKRFIESLDNYQIKLYGLLRHIDAAMLRKYCVSENTIDLLQKQGILDEINTAQGVHAEIVTARGALEELARNNFGCNEFVIKDFDNYLTLFDSSCTISAIGYKTSGKSNE